MNTQCIVGIKKTKREALIFFLSLKLLLLLLQILKYHVIAFHTHTYIYIYIYINPYNWDKEHFPAALV